MGRAKQIANTPPPPPRPLLPPPPPPDPDQGYTVGGSEGNIPDEDVSQETIDILGGAPGGGGGAGWGFDQGPMYVPPEGPPTAFEPDTTFDLYQEPPPPPEAWRVPGSGFWQDLTEDGSGGFISPDEFFKKLTDAGVDAVAVRSAARSYAEWYREVWGPAQDAGEGIGKVYGFEIDPWERGWQPEPPPEPIAPLEELNFDGGVGGSGGQSGFNTEFVEGLQADIQRLEDLVTSWGTPAPVAAEDTSRNDEFQQLMMGLFYGGGNQPPPNPYGFGTIYGGY